MSQWSGMLKYFITSPLFLHSSSIMKPSKEEYLHKKKLIKDYNEALLSCDPSCSWNRIYLNRHVFFTTGAFPFEKYWRNHFLSKCKKYLSLPLHHQAICNKQVIY